MENPIRDLAIIAVAYGGYISLIKLIGFLVLMFPWLPLTGWVYEDSEAVETNQPLWTAVMLATGAISIVIWIVMPFFLIGMFVYIIALTTAALVYVKHRNQRVMDFDRVLTAEHLKGLLSKSAAESTEQLKGFTLVTAHGNEVPLPQPRTPDFYGYKMSLDLLTDAQYRRADTVTFVPAPQGYAVTYTVDGAPVKQPDIARDQMELLLGFMKKLGALDEAERRKPQKGRFRLNEGKIVHEWELMTAGSTAGEQARLTRILGDSVTKLEEIGLMPDQFEQLSAIRNIEQGLFLVSGPKRSGVTTSFYALLRNHDAFMNSINTVERKTSGTIPNVTQTIFDPAVIGRSFGEELERVIRMGPDIVGVADCEDAEGARAVCKGAADAKIVYITLEADSVITALRKWMKYVGDRKVMTHTLLGISNQRLLRKLCPECKQAYAPNKDLFRKFNINAEKTKVLYRAGKVIYDKHGKPLTCENCQGTGFVGRTGVFEMIMLNDDLRKVIRKAKTMQEISTQFRRARMLSLQEQALRKVINGTTSINEMIRVLSPPKKKTRSAAG